MILVTGATGLVGAHLILKLISSGKSVRALYRSEAKKEYTLNLLSQLIPSDQKNLLYDIDWFKGNILDMPLLADVFKDIEQVYHCAAAISFNSAKEEKIRKTNIEGTANIVNQSLLAGVQKLCYVSSIAALGENTTGAKIDEKQDWNPELEHSIYAITKYGGEMEVWRGTQEGLQAIIVNPGIIIGSGFYKGGSGFLFKKIHKGLSYYTSGTTGYVSISDVTRAMITLMESPINNERFILVGDHLTYKEAFTKIAKALQVKPPQKEASPGMMKLAFYAQWISHLLFRTSQYIFKSSLRSAFSHTLYDSSKIEKTLDFEFESVDQAIKETASFYLEHEA